jgi:LEA14-like dessication related protein
MKNGKKLAVIFILSLLIIAAVVIYVCRKKILAHYIPVVEQTGIIRIKIKNDTSYMSSALIVKNLSFLKINIDSIKYKISLFGKTYLQSNKFIGVVLPAHGQDTVEFSLKIPYAAIIKDLAKERKKGDSASYSVNVSLQYSTIFGKAEFPINKSARLKIPQPPELKIVDIEWKRIRFKRILANARVELVNYNDVELEIKKMSYSMKIHNRGDLKGMFKKSVNIKPHGTTYIDLPLEIHVSNMGKTLFEILINKDKYHYSLTLDAVLESKDPQTQSFHILLTKNGTAELKK